MSVTVDVDGSVSEVTRRVAVVTRRADVPAGVPGSWRVVVVDDDGRAFAVGDLSPLSGGAEADAAEVFLELVR